MPDIGTKKQGKSQIVIEPTIILYFPYRIGKYETYIKSHWGMSPLLLSG
jgi:hypothetical protein